jgi:cyclohexyl-isocyanide hydratase
MVNLCFLMNFKKIKKIGIIVFPDVEELDFVGVFNVLSKVKRVYLKNSWSLKIIGTQKNITCANGLKIYPDSVYKNLKNFDLIIVPGGMGKRRLMQQKKFTSYLQTYSKTKPIASVCTGASLLGKAGFLKDEIATIHSLHLGELTLFCKKVVKKRIVRDGNIITSGGITSSLDLGLYLVEKSFGKKVMNEIEKILEYQSQF